MRWFQGWATKRRRRSSSGFKLNSEPLEDRNLLAGDVLASVSGLGDLVITGDAEANQIAIVRQGDFISVEGLDGTTIGSDGTKFDILAEEVTGNIRVATNDGDDSVQLYGNFGDRSASIITGNGNDNAVVGGYVSRGGGTSLGDLNVNMGNGEDDASLESAYISGNADIKMGFSNDADQFRAKYSHVENDLKIHTGNSAGNSYCGGYYYYRGESAGGEGVGGGSYYNDTVDLRGQQVGGNLSISGTAGGQCVTTVDSDVDGNTKFLLGGGDDSVQLIDTALSGDFLTSLAAGDDVFESYYNYFDGNVSVLGGTGDDSVYLTESYFSGSAAIHGGSGDNHVDIEYGYLGDTLITGGGNSDSINMQSPYIEGTVRMLTGGGDDSVEIEGGSGYASIFGDVFVTLGDGDDVFDLDEMSVFGKVTISAGGGNDAAHINGLQNGFGDFARDSEPLEMGLSLTMGGGQDAITIGDSVVSGNTKANTGAGNDEVQMNDNHFYGSVNFALGGGSDEMLLEGENEFSDGARFKGGSGKDRLTDMTDGSEEFQIQSMDVYAEEIVDLFSVSSSGSSSDSIQLTAGVNYRIQASGGVSIGGGVTNADAHYVFSGGVANQSPIHGLRMDGLPVTWADAYNPDHVYSIEYVGTDETVSFEFADDAYGDNAGSIGVSIFEIVQQD